MSYRENLIYMMQTNRAVVKGLLDDISDEESLITGTDFINHIRWQAGHLVFCNAYALMFLEDEKTDFEYYRNKYGKLFGGGINLSDDPSIFPSIEEIRNELYKLYDRYLSYLSEVPDEILLKKLEKDPEKRPVWQRVTFLCMHEFYHAGQIVQIRRSIGRDRPFD